MFVSGRGLDAGPKQACSAPAIGGPWEASVSSEAALAAARAEAVSAISSLEQQLSYYDVAKEQIFGIRGP